MKKVLCFLSVIILVSVAAGSVFALKTYNASKSNTASTVILDSADREVSRLVGEAEKEAMHMAGEMIRMERAKGYRGKVEIQVSIDVQIRKQTDTEADPAERMNVK